MAGATGPALSWAVTTLSEPVITATIYVLLMVPLTLFIIKLAVDSIFCTIVYRYVTDADLGEFDAELLQSLPSRPGPGDVAAPAPAQCVMSRTTQVLRKNLGCERTGSHLHSSAKKSVISLLIPPATPAHEMARLHHNHPAHRACPAPAPGRRRVAHQIVARAEDEERGRGDALRLGLHAATALHPRRDVAAHDQPEPFPVVGLQR